MSRLCGVGLAACLGLLRHCSVALLQLGLILRGLTRLLGQTGGLSRCWCLLLGLRG